MDKVLADRCLERAQSLADEADILQFQLDALDARREAEAQRWEANKSGASNYRFHLFMDKQRELRGCVEVCRADANHYRVMAA